MAETEVEIGKRRFGTVPLGSERSISEDESAEVDPDDKSTEPVVERIENVGKFRVNLTPGRHMVSKSP